MSDKMNPEVKVAWLAALRSGKYRQAHGALKKEDGYCCLGVLCDVVGVRWMKPEPSSFSGGFRIKDGSITRVGCLPDRVVKKAGLADHNGGLPKVVKFRGEKYFTLDSLNDGGASFKVIANIIERQL